MKGFVSVLVLVGIITFSSCSKKDKAEEPVKEAPKEEMVKFTADTNGTSDSKSPTVTMESNTATMMYYKHPSETSTSWLIYLGIDGNNYISMSIGSLDKKTIQLQDGNASNESAIVKLNNVAYTTYGKGASTGKSPGTITIESATDSVVTGSFDFTANAHSPEWAVLASYKLKGSFVVKRENWDVIAK